MSSQTSVASTPIGSPITPELANTSLPTNQEARNNLGDLVTGDGVSQRFSTSIRPSSSITPPPSSQPHNSRHAILCETSHDPTLTHSNLSSPPLTVVNGVKRESLVGGVIPIDATKEELREMLEASLADNKRLEVAVTEARMTAAHYQLQLNLLTIETENAAKRMEVEHDMTRREVDVLQNACQGRESPGQDYVAKLKAYCYAIEEDNAALVHRLEKAKKVIQMRDDDLISAKEKEDFLLKRIRENREHLNYLKSPGGIFHIPTPKPSHSSYPATPQQYRSTPKHTPMTGRSRHARGGSQEPFAALLLADQMLSQEHNRDNNSAPSTPILSRRADPRTPLRHSRGVQSLSSLPATPRSAVRPGTSNSTLLPSVQFHHQADPRTTSAQHSRERRRASRDSTISVSENGDMEEMARAAMSSFRGESEEVYESQASQTASEMLRIDPRESFEVASSRTHTPNPAAEKSSLLQTKIFGPVTKGVVDKRKRTEEETAPYSSKKMRVGQEGIGLGIGF